MTEKEEKDRGDEEKFEKEYQKQWPDFHIEWKEGIPYSVCDTVRISDTNVNKIYQIMLGGLREGREERKEEARVEASIRAKPYFDEIERRWQSKVTEFKREIPEIARKLIREGEIKVHNCSETELDTMGEDEKQTKIRNARYDSGYNEGFSEAVCQMRIRVSNCFDRILGPEKAKLEEVVRREEAGIQTHNGQSSRKNSVGEDGGVAENLLGSANYSTTIGNTDTVKPSSDSQGEKKCYAKESDG